MFSLFVVDEGLWEVEVDIELLVDGACDKMKTFYSNKVEIHEEDSRLHKKMRQKFLLGGFKTAHLESMEDQLKIKYIEMLADFVYASPNFL